MAELCTTPDIEALLGYTVPEQQSERLSTLILMASAIVEPMVAWPEDDEIPWVVRYVTASLVVRAIANPGQLDSETVGTYRATFTGGGMTLTAEDILLLGPWLVVTQPGQGAYSTWTPTPGEVLVDTLGGAFAFERDLDS